MNSKGEGALFNPGLRERGKNRMVYSTSVGYRLVFCVTALIIILGVASVAGKSFFDSFNVFSCIIIGVCLFAALYLERWIFDKETNLFESNVGILFVYSRKKRSLDTLQKVVLQELGVNYTHKPKLLRWTSRKTAMLSVVDRDGNVYGLDMVKGGSVREARISAEKLSTFCGIPLEDNLGDLSAETHL